MPATPRDRLPPQPPPTTRPPTSPPEAEPCTCSMVGAPTPPSHPAPRCRETVRAGISKDTWRGAGAPLDPLQNQHQNL